MSILVSLIIKYIFILFSFKIRGEAMNNKSNTLEDRLNLLEKYQVFLGIIVALVMQIIWDNLNRDSSYVIWRFISIIFFALCVYSLINVCIFYLLLYIGDKVKAERIGIINLVIVNLIFLSAFFSVSILFYEKKLFFEWFFVLGLGALMIIMFSTYLREHLTIFLLKWIERKIT